MNPLDLLAWAFLVLWHVGCVAVAAQMTRDVLRGAR